MRTQSTVLVLLILLVTLVPLVEIAVLLQVYTAASWVLGRGLGLLTTLAIIVAVSVAGAWLAHRQGLAVLEELRAKLDRGEMPTDPAIDGLLVLFGAVLLMVPGFVTDLVGMVLLLPVSRSFFREAIKAFIVRKIASGGFSIRLNLGVPGFVFRGPPGSEPPPGPGDRGGHRIDPGPRS